MSDACCHFGPVVVEGLIVGHYFSCKWPEGEEAQGLRMLEHAAEAQYAEAEAERVREATALHDPDRCDPVNVRREFGDRGTVNLGLRVNRLGRAGTNRRLQLASE